MWELFVLGSFGFWALVVIASVILLYCAENDRGGLATLTVIGSLCLLNWCGNIPVFSYIWHNPLAIIPGIAGYFVLGTLWGIGKWYFYVREQLARYYEVKQKFIDNKKLSISVYDAIPEELKEEWVMAIRSFYDDYCGHYAVVEVNPKIAKHKMQMYVWIAYWPWSFVWTMINDPVRKIFRAIYNRIAGMLQAISDSLFKDTKKDFK
jgi:hypothetical protein